MRNPFPSPRCQLPRREPGLLRQPGSKKAESTSFSFWSDIKNTNKQTKRFKLKIIYIKHQKIFKLNEKVNQYISRLVCMIDMVELSDKNYKAAIIKMFQQTIINKLKTIKNKLSSHINRKCQQENINISNN